MTENQRGGARVGAGRKASADGPSVVIGVSVPSDVMTRVDAVAKAKGWNRSKAITEAAKLLLKRYEAKEGSE